MPHSTPTWARPTSFMSSKLFSRICFNMISAHVSKAVSTHYFCRVATYLFLLRTPVCTLWDTEIRAMDTKWCTRKSLPILRKTLFNLQNIGLLPLRKVLRLLCEKRQLYKKIRRTSLQLLHSRFHCEPRKVLWRRENPRTEVLRHAKL
jgi:hypothetical protein